MSDNNDLNDENIDNLENSNDEINPDNNNSKVASDRKSQISNNISANIEAAVYVNEEIAPLMDEVGDLLEFDLNPLQSILKNLYNKVNYLERNFEDYRKSSDERIKDNESSGTGLSWLMNEFIKLRDQNPMEYIAKVERKLIASEEEMRVDYSKKHATTNDRVDELTDLMNSKIELLNGKVNDNSSDNDKFTATLNDSLKNIDNKLKNVDAVLEKFGTFENKFNDLENLVGQMQNTFAKAETMKQMQNDLDELRKLLSVNDSKYDDKFKEISDNIDKRFQYQSKIIAILEDQVKILKQTKVEVEDYETTLSKIVTLEIELNQLKNDLTLKNKVNELDLRLAEIIKSQNVINDKFIKDFQNIKEFEQNLDNKLIKIEKINSETKDKVEKFNTNLRYLSDNKLDKFDFEKIEEKMFKVEGEMHKVSGDLKKYDNYAKEISKLKDSLALVQGNSENRSSELEVKHEDLKNQFTNFTKLKMFNDFSEYVRSEMENINKDILKNKNLFVSKDEMTKLKNMIKNLKLNNDSQQHEGDAMMTRKPICASCNQFVNIPNTGRDYYAWNELQPNPFNHMERTAGMSYYGTGFSTKLSLLKNTEVDAKLRTTQELIKNRRSGSTTNVGSFHNLPKIDGSNN